LGDKIIKKENQLQTQIAKQNVVVADLILKVPNEAQAKKNSFK